MGNRSVFLLRPDVNVSVLILALAYTHTHTHTETARKRVDYVAYPTPNEDWKNEIYELKTGQKPNSTLLLSRTIYLVNGALKFYLLLFYLFWFTHLSNTLLCAQNTHIIQTHIRNISTSATTNDSFIISILQRITYNSSDNCRYDC